MYVNRKRKTIAMLNTIAQMIYDKKGFNILALDVQGISTITDYLLIAEGNVDRHVMAMAHTIVAEMKESGENPIHTEGLKTGEWVVLDYGQIMVHLFTPGFREKYSLERIWPESKLVELHIKTSNETAS
jgi:ribosome-associated protein